ncbi:MAG: sialate O-acetylesterase [Bacteroidota bacterium]
MSNLNLYLYLCLLLLEPAQAQLRLAPVFGSNMVLQQGKELPVWGTASAGERISIELNGSKKETVAADDGRWSVALPPQRAGGPFVMKVEGNNSVELKNVLIGEVWLASGQSNMEFSLDKSTDGDAEIAAANDDDLRLLTVKRAVSETVQTTFEGKWQSCNPKSVRRFSAVAYYFAKHLRATLKIPVGIIHSSWGGTAAESWIPHSALDTDPDFAPILERWEKDKANYPTAFAEFREKEQELLKKWEDDSVRAVAENRVVPQKPRPPRGDPGSRDTPSGQYNAMIAPLVPLAIEGVIWYQGEANASRAYQYRTLFPVLIKEWRSVWSRADLPFYYVQLPNLARQPEPSRSGWAELREAQLMTLNVPHTGMAVTIDVGDPANLHPTNKKPVGERLALIAEAKVYGQKVEYSGPVYRSFKGEGNKIRISFDHAESGLVAKGGELKGFFIAGQNMKFMRAKAVIDGLDILVENELIAIPVAVRYAWADNPDCNLYNGAGLPASPFRTDDWPEVTYGRK